MSKSSIYRRHYCALALTLLVAVVLPAAVRAQDNTDLTLTPGGKVVSGGEEYRKFCVQCHGACGEGRRTGR